MIDMTKSMTLTILVSLYLVACANNTNDILDCSTINGTTFSSNGGKMQSILVTKCSGVACHSSGGAASNHWIVGEYNVLNAHFFDEVLSTVRSGTMPPSGSPKLTNEELDQFECWSNAGFPK